MYGGSLVIFKQLDHFFENRSMNFVHISYFEMCALANSQNLR